MSWTPFASVAVAQALLVWNIAALKISIDGIVNSFETPATTVKSAIVVYSLVVAASIMAGSRIVASVGARRVLRVALAIFGVAMLAMAWSPDSITLIAAQVAAGASAAAIIPASVGIITAHYSGEQQAQAFGWLSGARSLSLSAAFLLAGAVATWSDWRLTYVLLVLLSACAYFLTGGLGRHGESIHRRPIAGFEAAGFALIALAILFIGVGSEALTAWGVLRARPGAPSGPLNLSPALLSLVCGIVIIKLVLIWVRRRRAGERTAVAILEMLSVPRQRRMLFSIFTIGAISSAVTFLIPLYIEIVQGRTSLHTALALIPFTLASFGAAVLAGQLKGRISPQRLTRYAFVAVAAGLALFGAVIRNDWSDISVVVSLAMIGLGEGALVTLLFKAVAAAAPQDVADEVEPLCDATSHLAAAVGAGLAGALVVGVLSVSVQQHLSIDPATASELRTYLNLDRVSFVSNDRLQQLLELTPATPEQIAAAVRINTDARLFSLKLSFFVLAGLTLFGCLPAAHVPDDDARIDSAGHLPKASG